jgi:hypothetical protein
MFSAKQASVSAGVMSRLIYSLIADFYPQNLPTAMLK